MRRFTETFYSCDCLTSQEDAEAFIEKCKQQGVGAEISGSSSGTSSGGWGEYDGGHEYSVTVEYEADKRIQRDKKSSGGPVIMDCGWPGIDM